MTTNDRNPADLTDVEIIDEMDALSRRIRIIRDSGCPAPRIERRYSKLRKEAQRRDLDFY